MEKDFLQIAWLACTSPGPHTWSPGTGPALPSSPSPGTLRRLGRPTCTVASFPSCTRIHPTMCGPRTLTCEWTSPWKWVGVCGQGLVQLFSVHKISVWMLIFFFPPKKCFWFDLQARSEASSRRGMLSSSWPAGVQAPVTPTPCVWFWWLEQPKKGCLLSPSSLYIIFYSSPLHGPLTLTALIHTYSQLIEQQCRSTIHLKELLWDGVEACPPPRLRSLHDFLSSTSFAGPSI